MSMCLCCWLELSLWKSATCVGGMILSRKHSHHAKPVASRLSSAFHCRERCRSPRYCTRRRLLFSDLALVLSVHRAKWQFWSNESLPDVIPPSFPIYDAQRHTRVYFYVSVAMFPMVFEHSTAVSACIRRPLWSACAKVL